MSAVTYYFIDLRINGSELTISKSPEIDYIYIDITIITVNHFSSPDTVYYTEVLYQQATLISQYFGSGFQDPSVEYRSGRYLLPALQFCIWNQQNHMSFRFQEGFASNYIVTWESNATYTGYQFFVITFQIQKCTSLNYPYMIFNIQKCYSECPPNYYVDTSNNRCLTCVPPPNCTKCATETTCAVCD